MKKFLLRSNVVQPLVLTIAGTRILRVFEKTPWTGRMSHLTKRVMLEGVEGPSAPPKDRKHWENPFVLAGKPTELQEKGKLSEIAASGGRAVAMLPFAQCPQGPQSASGGESDEGPLPGEELGGVELSAERGVAGRRHAEAV